MLRDVAYAFRSLRRSPAFTLTAALTIALGVGANTAVFQRIYTVLLDPLPFREPDRLVHIAETHPSFPAYQVAAPDFFDWQRRATSFEEIAAHTIQEMNKWTIVGDGEPEPIQCVQASYRLFPMMGIQPLLGRVYSQAEETQKSPVVLISEGLWRKKYGASESIIGRQIRLVGTSVTVIGVIAAKQAQPNWADLWMPLSLLDPALTETRRFHALEVIGRLRKDATLNQAQAEMKGIAAALAQEHPATNANIGAAVLPLNRWITGETRPALLIAWTAVSLILLLACANVAHLVLVRTLNRSREIAVRAALGASAGQLTRFLLIENLSVALVGGLAGTLAAWFTTGGLAPQVTAFALTATLLSVLIFAAPAILQARHVEFRPAAITSTRKRRWFGSAVIAAEVALALVVVFGAALLYRSFDTLLHERPGFTATNVTIAEIPLALDWGKSRKKFDEQVAPRLREIPGVTVVAAANTAPMALKSTEQSRFTSRFGIPGETYTEGSYPVAQIRWTTPDYFKALNIPLMRGRMFNQSDFDNSGHIVNESFARKYFPGQDPVGKQLLINVVTPNPVAVPIIGVVADVRDLSLDLEPVPIMYSLSVSNRMTVLIRSQTEIPPAAIRTAIHSVSPDAAITTLAPLQQIMDASLARRREALQLLGTFAALAALLTVIGVYGVVAYALSWRTGEFAIRSALGATRADMFRLIATNFATPTLIGLAAGAALAVLFATAMRTQLYRLSPADPKVLATTTALILALILLAAAKPATRAAATSPMSIPRE